MFSLQWGRDNLTICLSEVVGPQKRTDYHRPFKKRTVYKRINTVFVIYISKMKLRSYEKPHKIRHSTFA